MTEGPGGYDDGWRPLKMGKQNPCALFPSTKDKSNPAPGVTCEGKYCYHAHTHPTGLNGQPSYRCGRCLYANWSQSNNNGWRYNMHKNCVTSACSQQENCLCSSHAQELPLQFSCWEHADRVTIEDYMRKKMLEAENMPKPVKALVELSDEQLRPLAEKLHELMVQHDLGLLNWNCTDAGGDEWLNEELGVDEEGGMSPQTRLEAEASHQPHSKVVELVQRMQNPDDGTVVDLVRTLNPIKGGVAKVVEALQECNLAESPGLQRVHDGLSEAMQAISRIPEGRTGWLHHARECTVRLAVYDRTAGKVLALGSGGLVSREGLVLTASHIFTKRNKGEWVKVWQEGGQHAILVGQLQLDTGVTHWNHTATMMTSEELRMTMTERQQPVDIAVVKIDQRIVSMKPEFKVEPTEPGQTFPYLKICNTVSQGDDMWVLGYPPQKIRGLMVDRKVVNRTSECADGWLLTDMMQTCHSGVSGGPALNDAGQCIGIMSCDYKGLTHIRDIALGTTEHGLPETRVKPLVSWRETIAEVVTQLHAQQGQTTEVLNEHKRQLDEVSTMHHKRFKAAEEDAKETKKRVEALESNDAASKRQKQLADDAKNPRPQFQIFVSYGRGDANSYADMIHKGLTADGYTCFVDRQELPIGQPWPHKLLKALDECVVLVALVDLKFLNSCDGQCCCKAEVRRAHVRGVPVLPILLPHLKDRSLVASSFLNELLPEKAQSSKWQAGMPALVATQLAKDYDIVPYHVLRQGPLFRNVPELPRRLTERSELNWDKLEAQVIQGGKTVTAITASATGGTESKAVIVGTGGIGKTIIARMLCHRPKVQSRFSSGVVWLTIGKDCGAIRGLQKRLLSLLLQDEDEKWKLVEKRIEDDERAAQEEIGKLLAERRYLVVLDDAWDSEVIQKLLPHSSLRQSRVVVTTRMRDLLEATSIEVGLLAAEASLKSLLKFAGVELCTLSAEHREQATTLANRCKGHIHTLAICGGMVNKTHDNWQGVVDKLERGIAKRMKPKHLATDYNESVFGALEASYDDLLETEWEVERGVEWTGKQLQEMFCDLAVFPEDTRVPRTTLYTMQYGVHSHDCVDTMLHALADRSLVDVHDCDVHDGCSFRAFSLHDNTRDFLLDLLTKASLLEARHVKLLQAYESLCEDASNWLTGPHDSYLNFFAFMHVYRNQAELAWICHHVQGIVSTSLDVAKAMKWLNHADTQVQIDAVMGMWRACSNTTSQQTARGPGKEQAELQLKGLEVARLALEALLKHQYPYVQVAATTVLKSLGYENENELREVVRNAVSLNLVLLGNGDCQHLRTSALKYASKKLQSDKEVALAALSGVPGASLSPPTRTRTAASDSAPASTTYLVHEESHILMQLAYVSKARYAIGSASQTVKVVPKNVAVTSALEYTSSELRGDEEVVLAALRQDGHALSFAAEKLRGDSEFMLDAVRESEDALQYASEELRSNEEFMLTAFSHNGHLLRTSKDRKYNEEFVLAAVSENGEALEYASDKLRGHKKVVLAAARRDGEAAMQHCASEELKCDEEAPCVSPFISS